MFKSNTEPLLVDRSQLEALVAGSKPVMIIDVRSAEEYAAGTIDGAVHIPGDQVALRAAELSHDTTVVTVCNHGGPRSCGAAEQLRGLGFAEAFALKGGVRGAREV